MFCNINIRLWCTVRCPDCYALDNVSRVQNTRLQQSCERLNFLKNILNREVNVLKWTSCRPPSPPLLHTTTINTLVKVLVAAIVRRWTTAVAVVYFLHHNKIQPKLHILMIMSTSHIILMLYTRATIRHPTVNYHEGLVRWFIGIGWRIEVGLEGSIYR